ncbi:MAG TPA: GntR family transcriptional regulator [Xanthobacteraceae bacterium]|jgi:DNA-binding GntR family transcriptional regulator
MPTIAKPATRSTSRRDDSGARPAIRSDRVRREIADQIISGVLRPGQELDEKKLAEGFNVSRTPVREALRQLAAASLVEWRPHQSAIVAKITPSKMVEMFEVMAELEGFCGRLAARRMTPAEHASLTAIHRQFRPYVENRDREGYHALNKSFHEAIYAGSHNLYLKDQATALYDRLAPYRAYQLKRPEALRLASEEHQAIIDAIVAGNGDEAARLLMQHVSLSNELFADLVAALTAAETAA